MPSPPASPQSVLVIDDDEVMRELLLALLEAEGHAVTAVTSGEEALALLSARGTAPDIVLTDLRMPGMDTAAMLEKLHTMRTPGALLLGMSGSPPAEEEVKWLDGFLRKPFDMEDFHTAVEEAKTAHTTVGTPPALAGQSISTDAAAAEVLDRATFQKLSAALPLAQLRELYRLTIHDVHDRLDIMRSAVAQDDFATCRREAHAIKGAAGMVGAAELRTLTAAIEAGAPIDTPALNEIAGACDRLGRMLDALP